MSDPIDDFMAAFDAYRESGTEEDRVVLRDALRRCIKVYVRRHAPDPEVYT